MANPSYPDGLPPPLVDGNSYAPNDDDGVLRSQFPGGLKLRPRVSAMPEIVMFRLILTRAQVYILDQFYGTTLKKVLPFSWKEFRDPAFGPATYRFRQRPTFDPAGSGDYWYANLQLDLLTPFTGTFPLGLLNEDDDELTT